MKFSNTYIYDFLLPAAVGHLSSPCSQARFCNALPNEGEDKEGTGRIVVQIEGLGVCYVPHKRGIVFPPPLVPFVAGLGAPARGIAGGVDPHDLGGGAVAAMWAGKGAFVCLKLMVVLYVLNKRCVCILERVYRMLLYINGHGPHK